MPNDKVDVIDTEDLVRETVRQEKLVEANELGLEFGNTELIKNSSLELVSFHIINLSSYIFSNKELFCIWKPDCVELALNDDYYLKLNLFGSDTYLEDEIVSRFTDYIGFPYRFSRSSKNYSIDLYNNGFFVRSVDIRSHAKYDGGIGKRLKKKVLLQRRQ